MKINWKVRFQNKVWVLAFASALVAFLYQLLSLCGVTPKIAEDTILQLAGMLVNLLVMLGVVVDPTTAGAGDSERALHYDVPGGEDPHEQ